MQRVHCWYSALDIAFMRLIKPLQIVEMEILAMKDSQTTFMATRSLIKHWNSCSISTV